MSMTWLTCADGVVMADLLVAVARVVPMASLVSYGSGLSPGGVDSLPWLVNTDDVKGL